ncbi:38014_t:CDS:2, partial [Gigaspora margarita]
MLGLKQVDHFTGNGMEHIHRGGPNDGGVNTICDIRGIKLIILCKNWTNSIGSIHRFNM